MNLLYTFCKCASRQPVKYNGKVQSRAREPERTKNRKVRSIAREPERTNNRKVQSGAREPERTNNRRIVSKRREGRGNIKNYR